MLSLLQVGDGGLNGCLSAVVPGLIVAMVVSAEDDGQASLSKAFHVRLLVSGSTMALYCGPSGASTLSSTRACGI